MARLHLDGIEFSGLTDLDGFDLPLTTLFPDARPELLSKDVAWLEPAALSNGILHLTVRSWLIRVAGRVILVDTCVGAHKERPNWPAWHRRDGAEWLAALATEGLGPDDIDIVLCTHLHADHVGWNTRLLDGRWVPTFPNARYIVGRSEFQHWKAVAASGDDKHGAFADSVLPVEEAGQIDLVDDGWEMGPGLTLHAAPGHTPGHMCLHADCGAVFCGDVIHSPVQLARPDWSSAFCSDPDLARRSRQALLNDVAGSGKLLIPAHFPDPGWTRIAADGAGYRPVS